MSNLITPASIVLPTVGAGVNVQAKSLKMYFSEMRFCNYPQLLLISPERQTQVETMGGKTTQASHQELHFEEVLILKPRADNTGQHDVSYTLIAFTVFSERNECGTIRHIAKMETQNGTCSMIKISLRSMVILQ